MKSTKKRLISLLSEHLPSELLRILPSRYPILGNSLLIRLNPNLLPYKNIVGKALLELFPRIKSVWGIIDTKGIIREPQTIHLAGDSNPIIIHKELNTYFKFDISKITFSPGNSYERQRLLKIITDDSVVIDMFTCVGNLSLPLVTNKKAKLVIGFEINPYAYHFLLSNIIINHVQDRFIAILGNNYLINKNNFADHVLMGYLPEPTTHQLYIAIKTVKSGGVIHYHALAPKKDYEHKKQEIVLKVSKFKEGVSIEDITIDFIKSYSPSYDHIVIRLKIKKKNI